MTFRRSAHQAGSSATGARAGYTLLLGLLLLSLLHAVQPSLAHATQWQPTEKIGQLLGSGLHTSRQELRPGQQHADTQLAPGTGSPQDFLFTFYLLLALVSATSLCFTRISCRSQSPVITRPGAPRGPPADILV